MFGCCCVCSCPSVHHIPILPLWCSESSGGTRPQMVLKVQRGWKGPGSVGRSTVKGVEAKHRKLRLGAERHGNTWFGRKCGDFFPPTQSRSIN